MTIRSSRFVFLAAGMAAFLASFPSLAQQEPLPSENELHIDYPIGIGLMLKAERGRVIIDRVLLGTPAGADGRIEMGDEIMAIGESEGAKGLVTVTGRSVNEIAALLRGPENTMVTIQVNRRDQRGRKKNLLVSLRRAPLPIYTEAQSREILEKRGSVLTRLPPYAVGSSVIASSPMPDFKEPAPDAWRKITNGMSEAQVLELLGMPIKRYDGELFSRSHWEYGWLRFNSETVPRPPPFSVQFLHGKVTRKSDPFGGAVSVDGKPTRPVLMLPGEGQTFEHFPRYVDMRWQPSAGSYPMEYLIQIEVRGEQGKWTLLRELSSRLPYSCDDFGTMGLGRWRVKAWNSAGESIWSEYRTFKFLE